MKFHFDPNKQQSKKAKVVENVEIKDLRQVVPAVENNNVQIEKKIWEPQCQDELDDYPVKEIEIEDIQCNEDEKYLCLYQAYFCSEIDRLLQHYSKQSDFVYFAKLIKEKMLKFIRKEREMKQKYSYKEENYNLKLKKMELQQQMREYENQIEKMKNALRYLEQCDIENNLGWLELNNDKQRFDEEQFKERIKQFEDDQITQRLQVDRKVKNYMIKLFNDKQRLLQENEEIEKQIEQLEQQLGDNINPYRQYQLWI